MSREKIQKVSAFPKAETVGQMKRFIGLANYCPDYVNHHSDFIIENYEKNIRSRNLVKPQESTKAFH